MSKKVVFLTASLLFLLVGLIFMIISGGDWFDSAIDNDEVDPDSLTWKQWTWMISWSIAIILFVVAIVMLVLNK